MSATNGKKKSARTQTRAKLDERRMNRGRGRAAKPVSPKPAEPAAPPSNISRPARPSALDSMPFMKAAVLPDEQSLNKFMDSVPKEMKAGGKVKKDRRDGIALRGKTRA